MKKRDKTFLYVVVVVLSFLFFNEEVGAFTYKLLEPSVGISEVGNIGEYAAFIYKASLGLAVTLSVFQIARGGFTYVTTDAFTGKQEAKEIITNAVIGLVLALSSYIILQFISPELINGNFEIPKVSAPKTSFLPGNLKLN